MDATGGGGGAHTALKRVDVLLPGLWLAFDFDGLTGPPAGPVPVMILNGDVDTSGDDTVELLVPVSVDPTGRMTVNRCDPRLCDLTICGLPVPRTIGLIMVAGRDDPGASFEQLTSLIMSMAVYLKKLTLADLEAAFQDRGDDDVGRRVLCDKVFAALSMTGDELRPFRDSRGEILPPTGVIISAVSRLLVKYIERPRGRAVSRAAQSATAQLNRRLSRCATFDEKCRVFLDQMTQRQTAVASLFDNSSPDARFMAVSGVLTTRMHQVRKAPKVTFDTLLNQHLGAWSRRCDSAPLTTARSWSTTASGPAPLARGSRSKTTATRTAVTAITARSSCGA